MSEWWGISKQNKLKKFQDHTNQFVNKLESILNEFENNGDTKTMSLKLKDSIKEFQDSVKNSF